MRLTSEQMRNHTVHYKDKPEHMVVIDGVDYLHFLEADGTVRLDRLVEAKTPYWRQICDAARIARILQHTDHIAT